MNENDTIDKLGEELKRPEAVEYILAGHSNLYSLGIGLDKSLWDLLLRRRRLAIHLGVVNTTVKKFPKYLEVGGTKYPIVVNRNWTPPHAL